jgi:Amt family ammonium transporter
VWAAHGVGGLVGVILLGVFASVAVNAAGADGLAFGGPSFFGKQATAAVLVGTYSLGVTWLILKVLNRFEPVRVPDDIEQKGLDTEMGEQYILG